METKEAALSRIKSQMAWLGWSDKKCLEFYEQQFKTQPVDTEETCPVFYAYYIQPDFESSNNKITYGVVTEEEFLSKKISDKAYVYERCFNKNKAREFVEKWKDEVRHEENWDRYMNS